MTEEEIMAILAEARRSDYRMQFVKESNKIEGILREPSREELREYDRFLARKQITMKDLVQFVKVYQPNAVLRDKAELRVWIGGNEAPRGGDELVTHLQELLADTNSGEVTAYEIHQRYEHLHPFTDGNGRSGRMLWAWMMEGNTPLGFLHHWYYQSLQGAKDE